MDERESEEMSIFGESVNNLKKNTQNVHDENAVDISDA